MRVAIAAAGSGGHVYPALAVADALRGRGLDHTDIVFFGGDRMEATTVPDAGYPFVRVEISGLRRSLSADNLRLPGVVRRARASIEAEMRSRQLDVMVVFGGYIAGPAALAARSLGRPLVVHEANAVPGLANRLIARRADTVYTSFRAAAERLPGARVIGSPLRGAFDDFDAAERRPAARRKYGVDPERRVLGVVGGSLGAAFLNDVAASVAARPDRAYSIVHVTGPTHADAMGERSASIEDWVTLPFEDAMVDLYAASDLVLSRGGALTVSELQATRTPAVIVPLPAGRGYQRRNADDLTAAGGAVVVEQPEEGTLVASVVADLMADRARLEAMRDATHAVDHALAARRMADTIVELADA